MEQAGSTILGALAAHGPWSLIAAALIWWIWSKDKEHRSTLDAKDKEIKAERDARIADAKLYHDAALRLQAQAIDVVNKVTTVFEEMKEILSKK